MTAEATALIANIFPMDCPLCGTKIQSLDDRMEWHGLGNCTELCGLCLGECEVEGSQCPVCNGTGVEKGKTT